MANQSQPIWIDLDNSPHVPFFLPIADRLRSQGFSVDITARDAYNVNDLVHLHRVECTTIGRHSGKSKLMKLAGLGVRAAQLAAHAASRKPSLAVSHGSRAQMMASKLLRVPSVLIADYEHVTHVTRPDYLIVPAIIPDEIAQKICKNVLRYKGIKEDVYAAKFSPDPSTVRELSLVADDLVVTARPPATEAHYHVHESEEVFDASLAHVLAVTRARIILLPRNERQKAQLESRYRSELQSGKITIPNTALDGLNLVWHSDLVISGGGTMNREAAALGVPVYSTFRGPLGAVDKYLAAEGRLVLLESPADVPRLLKVTKRSKTQSSTNFNALDCIVDHIIRLAQTHR